MNRPALKYERLLNAIHEVYYCSDVHGNIIEVSPSIETVAGHHWRDVLGKPATVFYRYPKDCLRFIKMLKTQGFVEDHELELMHRDGHSIHVSANAHMLFDAQNNIIGAEGMLRDISDRVALEKKLSDLNDELELRVKQRTSELAEKNLQLQTLSQAIEQSAEGFIITDCSGRVNYVNQAFEHINGYSSNEIIGHTLSVLSSGKHNADFFHDIWNTIRAGRVWEGTIINRRKDGTDYPALMTIVPITMHGKIEFYSAIQQDISEQQALEAQFRQAQKMDAMGTLVGGIAHDFNNMLAGLLMHLYLAKQNINNTTKALATLDKAERLGYQASEIIKGLLIFSRDDETEMQTLAFNTILRDSIDMLKVSIPEHIQLKLNLCQQNISIAGNTTQLQQVLMNLLNNARDALKTNLQGQIDVDLDYFIIDQEFADQHPDLHEDAMLHLSVSDNGCGIPEAIIDKIFDPFFTTKAAGQGTGLGLAMVYGCIKNHQGILEVESNPAAGTTFHIYLPLIKDHFDLRIIIRAFLISHKAK